MVGVRYHLDLREIEGNVVGAFSKENTGGKGVARRGAVWGSEGLAQPHGADLAWGGMWRSNHSLTGFFFLQWWFQFQVPHMREFKFELDFIFLIFFSVAMPHQHFILF
jgi:hypothetical protein